MKTGVPSSILRPPNETVWAPPLDVQDLAVRLEAEGITTSVAQAQYGFADVWSMAQTYFPVAQCEPAITIAEERPAGIWRDYAKGMAFATPTLLCCLTVLVWRISLWGGPLSSNEAVAMIIAAISGFVVTGGFIQVVGRQGHFYKHSREWQLCAWSCWSAVKLGVGALCVAVSLGFLANAYFRWMPLDLFGWSGAFALCIGSYLLASAVLYVLDAELWVAVATMVGTGVGALLFHLTHASLLLCQVGGISVATGACILVARLRFRRLGHAPISNALLPSLSRLVYTLWPYFAYGVLYYCFLFADRIVAWSAPTQDSLLVLQFRGEYETALDVCLFAFVVQVGWIHVGLVRFYRTVTREQKRLSMSGRQRIRNAMAGFYTRQLAMFAALSVVSTAGVLWAIYAIRPLHAVLSLRVAMFALGGTPFLAIGLWNIALLFALSRPALVVRAAMWALAINVVVGYLLSRVVVYDLAIVGFAAGAFALALISAWSCRKMLSNFDYHYFAAIP